MWNSLFGQIHTCVLYLYVWWMIKFDGAMNDMTEWMKIRR